MPERVLFISPHPDDVEFGAGMTILSRLDQGDTIKSLVICLGNNPAQHETREEEINQVRQSYAYEVGLLDRNAPDDLHGLIVKLEAEIKAFKPDVLYLPFGEDRHQDHKIVSEAATIAGRTVANRYYYCTPSTKRFEANHYFVGNAELLERKISLLACFFSQRSKAYLSPNEIKAYAQTNGRNALLYSDGVHYAEPFITQTLDFTRATVGKKILAKDVDFDDSFLSRSFTRVAELLAPFIEAEQITSKSYPWEVLELFGSLTFTNSTATRATSVGSLRIEGDVFVEEGAKLPLTGVIEGPVYISKDAQIQEYSVIMGPTFIGVGARVGYHSSVRGCLLAPKVQIGQRVDLTRVIILDNTMLSHGNTVGDSFIGHDCWLAGKTDVANLRADRRPVRANIGAKRYTTNGKYGATIEDGVKLPAAVAIMPGVYVSSKLRVQIRDLVIGNRVHKGK